MCEISWLAEKLSDYREGLCSMESILSDDGGTRSSETSTHFPTGIGHHIPGHSNLPGGRILTQQDATLWSDSSQQFSRAFLPFPLTVRLTVTLSKKRRTASKNYFVLRRNSIPANRLVKSHYPSVRTDGYYSKTAERMFIKFNTEDFYEDTSELFPFPSYYTALMTSFFWRTCCISMCVSCTIPSLSTDVTPAMDPIARHKIKLYFVLIKFRVPETELWCSRYVMPYSYPSNSARI
jgi:hypothetical protein